MLRNKTSSVPQVDVATIVALSGDVINFTRSYPPPKINLADRDYFKAHLADPKLEVFLSAPVKNRGTGTWTFYLARKIRSRSGDANARRNRGHTREMNQRAPSALGA